MGPHCPRGQGVRVTPTLTRTICQVCSYSDTWSIEDRLSNLRVTKSTVSVLYTVFTPTGKIKIFRNITGKCPDYFNNFLYVNIMEVTRLVRSNMIHKILDNKCVNVSEGVFNFHYTCIFVLIFQSVFPTFWSDSSLNLKIHSVLTCMMSRCRWIPWMWLVENGRQLAGTLPLGRQDLSTRL